MNFISISLFCFINGGKWLILSCTSQGGGCQGLAWEIKKVCDDEGKWGMGGLKKVVLVRVLY